MVKALPHAGQKHGETVCCAGVTPDREWRRQFPIPFRRLESKFKRWELIEYNYLIPRDDRRKESRRVQEDTIEIRGELPARERAAFLKPLILSSTAIAASRGQSLTLIRPKNVRFSVAKKTENDLTEERQAYAEAARQQSLFDKELAQLEPCPYAFTFKYDDEEGKPHTSNCADWETAAMYRNFERLYGEQGALDRMTNTFGKEYPAKGMAFAMGTHSLYPDTWLLIGVLRLDPVKQMALEF